MALLYPGMAGAPQGLQMAYMRDPRLRLAQQLQAGGADTSPVGHWAQGAARLAQALAGMRMEDRAEGDYQKQADAYQNDMRTLYAPVMEQGAAGPGPRQGPGGATMRPANVAEINARLGQITSPYALQEARPMLQSAMEREAAIAARGTWKPTTQNGLPGQINTATNEFKPDPMPRASNTPRFAFQNIGGQIVAIDQSDPTKRSVIGPAGSTEAPKAARPMTPEERRAFQIPENVPAFMGPDGKPATLSVPRQEAVWQIDPTNPQIQVNVATGERKALPAPPAMNEGQANAALFADRMAAAEPIISQFGTAGTSWGNKIAAGVPMVGNALVSPDYQRLDQARRDFVNAVLRRESGAVIAESEFDNANRQYFPQPGDSQEVIAQKARNRRTALEGIARAAGNAYKPPGAPQAADGGGGQAGSDPLGIR